MYPIYNIRSLRGIYNNFSILMKFTVCYKKFLDLHRKKFRYHIIMCHISNFFKMSTFIMILD